MKSEDQQPAIKRRGHDKSSHEVPTVLLVRLQRSREELYKAVEKPSTKPIVLSVITRSFFRRLTIF